MPRWTYETADKFLVGRRKQHGNIAPYTYLERDGDMIVMKYGIFKRAQYSAQYSKEVVRLHPDGRIELTAPYKSPSIRDRIMFCTGWGSMLNQLGYWALRSKEQDYSFQDGMILHPDGSVTGYDPEPMSSKLKTHAKKMYQRHKLSDVESASGLTVGDVVFHEGVGQYYKVGQQWKRDLFSKGPFKVRKIQASQTRTLLWLTDLQDNPIKETVYENSVPSTKIAYQRVPVGWKKFRKDAFLSAAAQAIKTVAAK